MSDFLKPILLTNTTHPLILGLTLFTLALFLSFTLTALTFTALRSSDPYDCEEENITYPETNAIFLTRELRPLLLDDGAQDPLKDFPHGRYVGSAKRAKKQRGDRKRLRGVLEADWAGSSYGSFIIAAEGPRVGEKRRRGDEGCGRGKRVRVEESEEDSEW